MFRPLSERPSGGPLFGTDVISSLFSICEKFRSAHFWQKGAEPTPAPSQAPRRGLLFRFAPAPATWCFADTTPNPPPEGDL